MANIITNGFIEDMKLGLSDRVKVVGKAVNVLLENNQLIL